MVYVDTTNIPKNSFISLKATLPLSSSETYIPAKVKKPYIFPCISFHTDQAGGYNSILTKGQEELWHSPWGVDIFLHMIFKNIIIIIILK